MAIMDKKHRTLGYLPMPNIDPLGWSIRQITHFQTIDTNLSIGNLHLFFIEHITYSNNIGNKLRSWWEGWFGSFAHYSYELEFFNNQKIIL